VEVSSNATSSKNSSFPASALRIVIRGAAALSCVFGCLIDYGMQAALKRLNPRRRARVLQKWSSRLLKALRVRILVTGSPPPQGLIVSNHLSYLDILVFSAAIECVFVSKREVKAWPAIGWAASLAGTIYIDRTRRSDAHAIQPQIQAALSSGVRLVIFPEGTSSDGSRVLHFHSSLFQPSLDLDAPITAVALEYALEDGDARREVCYWGDMVLLPHLFNLMTKSWVQATVRFSSEQFYFQDRKEAARTMQLQVERLRGMASAVQH